MICGVLLKLRQAQDSVVDGGEVEDEDKEKTDEEREDEEVS